MKPPEREVFSLSFAVVVFFVIHFHFDAAVVVPEALPEEREPPDIDGVFRNQNLKGNVGIESDVQLFDGGVGNENAVDVGSGFVHGKHFEFSVLTEIGEPPGRSEVAPAVIEFPR